MIKKIEIGEKYRNINNKVTQTYTALHIHEDVLFYFWESVTMSGHSCMEAKTFMECVEEIPEEKVKYFQIYYKAKSSAKPYATTSLFTSKEEFLQYTGIREENLEFFHMEEVENQLENV